MEMKGAAHQSQRGKEPAYGLASALGWFSIGLGVAQITMPGRLARLVGVNDRSTTRVIMRMMGVREITSGIGLLTGRPAPWLWSRVGGDALDLSLLGSAMASGAGNLARTGSAVAAVAGVGAADVYAAVRALRVNGQPHGWRDVRRSVTIRRPVEVVFSRARDLENLPSFMEHLESVVTTDERHSYWRVSAPGGTSVEWTAEIVLERPNEEIAWRSAPGSDIEHEGRILFSPAPADRGTEVRVELRYRAPAGSLGVIVARLFGEEPDQQVRDDLRAMKQVLETGETVRSDASLGGRFLQRPGRPPTH